MHGIGKHGMETLREVSALKMVVGFRGNVKSDIL